MKRVALIGSSGGNLQRLGGANAAELLGEVRRQLSVAGISLAHVLFVAAERSMDVGGGSSATLWRLEDDEPHAVMTASLGEINARVAAEDMALANKIAAGDIDGLILVSADPSGVNRSSVTAAADRNLPAAGSGGTCVATAEAAGLRFVASSGTTGTNNLTRAVTYAAGLAREWRLPFKAATSAEASRSTWQRFDPRPVLSDALPAVVPIGVILGASQYLPRSVADEIHGPLLMAIPIVVSVFAASRISTLGLAGLIGGLIAGVIAQPAGMASALTAGFLAAALGNWLIIKAASWQWPATMANLVAAGGAGLVGGFIGGYALYVPSRFVDDMIALGVDRGLEHFGLWIGLVLGALMWLLMLRGLYHTFVIPIMVVEIAHSGLSFLATLDIIGLVVAAAGIAAANAWLPRIAVHRRPALHTLRITMLFGDYVEGVYPFFEADRRVLFVAALASTVAGGIAGLTGARSLSYIAPWLVPFIGTSIVGLAASVLACFALSFAATCVLNATARRLNSAPARV